MTSYTQAQAHAAAAIKELQKEKPVLGNLVLPHANGKKPMQINVEMGGGSPSECVETKLEEGKLHLRFNGDCLPKHGLDQAVVNEIKQDFARIGFPRPQDLNDSKQLEVLLTSKNDSAAAFSRNDELRKMGFRSSDGFYGDYLTNASVAVESWDPSTAPQHSKPAWVQSRKLALAYDDIPKVIPKGLIRLNTTVENKKLTPTLSINREIYKTMASQYGLAMANTAVTIATQHTYVQLSDAMLGNASNYREIKGGISIKQNK